MLGFFIFICIHTLWNALTQQNKTFTISQANQNMFLFTPWGLFISICIHTFGNALTQVEKKYFFSSDLDFYSGFLGVWRQRCSIRSVRCSIRKTSEGQLRQ